MIEEAKRLTGNFISTVRYHGRHVIPHFIDRGLAHVQFKLFGLR